MDCKSHERSLYEAEKETESHRGAGDVKMETDWSDAAASRKVKDCWTPSEGRGMVCGAILHQSLQKKPSLQMVDFELLAP